MRGGFVTILEKNSKHVQIILDFVALLDNKVSSSIGVERWLLSLEENENITLNFTVAGIERCF